MLNHGEVCLEISLYAGFTSSRALHRTCSVAEEAGTGSLRIFGRMTIQEAVEHGAYARRWKVWGPQPYRRGGMPVGRFPFHWWHPPVMRWSFREWHARGEQVGLKVLPLQDPLYYHLLHNQIFSRSLNRQRCTNNVCRTTAVYFGVMCKGKDRRMDICGNCSRNLIARGKINGAARLRELPAA